MGAKESYLFVSHTASVANPYSDPSLRYRCCNLAQGLAARGHRTFVVPQSVLEGLPSAFRGFDRYVFHRPQLTEVLAEFLVGLPPGAAVADFDDLIFDVASAELTPMVRLWKGSPATHRQNAALTAEVMRFISTITVSTAPLAAVARRRFPNARVEIVPNRLDPTFVGLARVLRAEHAYEARPYRFGYFSGTPSHDLDFEVAAPALAEALERDPQALLLLVGPVPLPEALEGKVAQTERMGLMPFHALPYAMSVCQTVLAPLERNPFTDAKSAIKFMEAAMLGCEVAVTPIPDMERFRSPLLKKCSTGDDWMEALCRDPMLPGELVEGAVADLEATITIERGLDSWTDLFEGQQAA